MAELDLQKLMTEAADERRNIATTLLAIQKSLDKMKPMVSRMEPVLASLEQAERHEEADKSSRRAAVAELELTKAAEQDVRMRLGYVTEEALAVALPATDGSSTMSHIRCSTEGPSHKGTTSAYAFTPAATPTSLTTSINIFPELTVSIASDEGLDVDATGVAAPTPTRPLPWPSFACSHVCTLLQPEEFMSLTTISSSGIPWQNSIGEGSINFTSASKCRAHGAVHGRPSMIKLIGLIPGDVTIPGLEIASANMSPFQRAPGNPYGNLQHMPAVGSELAMMMLLNQSGQNIRTPLSCHQSSYSSIIQNVTQNYMPPSIFGNPIGSIKPESMPSNEAQQQLHAPKMQRGDLESCEVQPATDSVSASELHVVGREPRNTDKYPSQSISEHNGEGEPRVKPRRSKKGSSRKTISENSEFSSAPSRICDDQQHLLEAKLVGCDTEHVNRDNNEGSSGARTHGNFAGQLQCQQVEQNGLVSPPKLESSISHDGGKSVNSFPNQGSISQFFDSLDWMVQPSYYQDSNGVQSVSASENIFSPSANIASTINTDTLETFQNSCLSDCFPFLLNELQGHLWACCALCFSQHKHDGVPSFSVGCTLQFGSEFTHPMSWRIAWVFKVACFAGAHEFRQPFSEAMLRVYSITPSSNLFALEIAWPYDIEHSAGNKISMRILRLGDCCVDDSLEIAEDFYSFFTRSAVPYMGNQYNELKDKFPIDKGLYTPWDPGSHTCLWMPFTCGLEDVQPRQPWPPPRPLELTGNTSLLGCSTACYVFDRGKSGKGEFTRPVLLLGTHTLALQAEFTGSQDALQFKITSEEVQLRPTPWPSFWNYAAAVPFQNSLAGVPVISLTEVHRLSCCSQSAEIYQSVLSHFARRSAVEVDANLSSCLICMGCTCSPLSVPFSYPTRREDARCCSSVCRLCKFNHFCAGCPEDQLCASCPDSPMLWSSC